MATNVTYATGYIGEKVGLSQKLQKFKSVRLQLIGKYLPDSVMEHKTGC